jgi:hypothetical protein
MGAAVIVRVISTILGAIVPLVMVSGFLSPTESSPFGAMSSFVPFQSIVSDNAELSPYAQYIPFLAGGGGAIAVWSIASMAASGIGSAVAVGSMRKSSMGDMEKRMKSMMSSANLGTLPEKSLPPDVNKVQYRIMTSFCQGSHKPKDVASELSMDKNEVEKEIAGLVNNGYITKKNKLTSKGLDLLS